jgi:hypothetical protein
MRPARALEVQGIEAAGQVEADQPLAMLSEASSAFQAVSAAAEV